MITVFPDMRQARWPAVDEHMSGEQVDSSEEKKLRDGERRAMTKMNFKSKPNRQRLLLFEITNRSTRAAT